VIPSTRHDHPALAVIPPIRFAPPVFHLGVSSPQAAYLLPMMSHGLSRRAATFAVVLVAFTLFAWRVAAQPSESLKDRTGQVHPIDLVISGNLGIVLSNKGYEPGMAWVRGELAGARQAIETDGGQPIFIDVGGFSSPELASDIMPGGLSNALRETPYHWGAYPALSEAGNQAAIASARDVLTMGQRDLARVVAGKRNPLAVMTSLAALTADGPTSASAMVGEFAKTLVRQANGAGTLSLAVSSAAVPLVAVAPPMTPPPPVPNDAVADALRNQTGGIPKLWVAYGGTLPDGAASAMTGSGAMLVQVDPSSDSTIRFASPEGPIMVGGAPFVARLRLIPPQGGVGAWTVQPIAPGALSVQPEGLSVCSARLHVGDITARQVVDAFGWEVNAIALEQRYIEDEKSIAEFGGDAVTIAEALLNGATDPRYVARIDLTYPIASRRWSLWVAMQPDGSVVTRATASLPFGNGRLQTQAIGDALAAAWEKDRLGEPLPDESIGLPEAALARRAMIALREAMEQ